MCAAEVRAVAEAVVKSDSSLVAGDASVTAVNGKFTDDSQFFADITPVHTKLSKCTEYLIKGISTLTSSRVHICGSNCSSSEHN